ncbi:F-box only protein 43 [Numida meleagris]|uniref:F-box only protein 43 n=1 Tax=Numida meleagris TaxID=8996 RepID=UPI000B3DCC60|nr:F-box only protein 43 [Numida meleagris]XP_021242361.1 F-box only protein 43 [Numida meleagris]XP_021242362.1 F-box only protein 43 [Numida meleagris]XP_021242363.1 F-box only protein 43 [Numida meleagris]XP_021242364.1 F-box only protein 43 [Numida meleagris]XP_021242365.1 F-box only protein 43 [Numida meleagris]XP_021242366.1 F-box only protein 43 [Numida meleagris]XP_021242367.1 F-box only protein 43 [Numida meleagris]XP_021242368.1 F-box only protein 43 [Numida meleagris]
MSDNHSVTFNIIKRNRLTSPSSSFQCSSFKDARSTSVFLDSGCNESVKDPDAEHKETPRATSSSLLQEHSDRIHPNALCSVSSIENEMNSISLSERREANRSTYFFETPKAGRKGSSLRRRLLLSKAGAAVGSCEKQGSSSGSSRKKLFPSVLSSEENLSQTASDSSKEKSCDTLRGSSAETEGSSPDCPKRRLSFSQQRTSTLDESKCKDPLLLETECFSPIERKDVTVSNTNEYSDSVLRSVSEGLLQTPTYSVLPEASDSKILTSVDSLVENFNFELCDRNNPSVKLASYPNISTPEDSGYNSLHLDKSGDSLSDHEGSYQEIFRKRKEGSKILDIKKKARKLERVRRLSTLREQGSQSETEDHHGSPSNSAHMLAEESFVTEDRELVLKEQTSEDLTVNYGDLSRTPALQIVHEICLQRQRSDKNQVSKNVDGTQIVALEHVLAGLIGKKMGLEKLDILTELKYRNLKHVLAIVLDASTVESLCSIWKVSKNWREIIVQDKSADRRRKLYIKQLKEEAEEYLLKAEDAATRLNVINRSALRPVQAQARTPVLQTPPSYTELTPRRCNSVPQSTSRREEYIKVAKTLFTDEALKPCPRCQYPAKYQLVKKWGLCSREACAFEFCILCLHAFHGSKECNSLSAKQKNKKDAPPGSAQSKRNLKRL